MSSGDSGLEADASSRVRIETQTKLNELLRRGRGSHSSDATAAQSIVHLTIEPSDDCSGSPMEWPVSTQVGLFDAVVEADGSQMPSGRGLQALSASAQMGLRLSLAQRSRTMARDGRNACSLGRDGGFDDLESCKISRLGLPSEALSCISFPRLSELLLDNNDLGDAGCASLAAALGRGGCPSLRTLSLQREAIGDEGCAKLADALYDGACPSLAVLDLRENGISDTGCKTVVQGLNGCPRLTTLDLSSNNISSLPDELAYLLSLSDLRVSDNSIAMIQVPLYTLVIEQLDSLSAESNDLEDPPQDIVDDLATLKQHLQRVQETELGEVGIARVMLLGESAHGKTTLCQSLLKGDTISTDEASGATKPPEAKPPGPRAVDIHDWQVGADDSLTIKLWDFEGHDVYYAACTCFYSRLCIYVLVVRIEVEQSEMEKAILWSISWLMSVRKAVAGKAQVLVVGTFPHAERKDNEHVLMVRLKQLENRLRNANNDCCNRQKSHYPARAMIHGAYWVDCHALKANSNLENVRNRVVALASSMVKNEQRVPPIYAATVRAHLELYKEDEGGNGPAGIALVRTYQDKVAGKVKVPDDPRKIDIEMKHALKFASDMGILHYFPDIKDKGDENDILDNLVFMDPLFLLQAIGTLIYDESTYRQYIGGLRKSSTVPSD